MQCPHTDQLRAIKIQKLSSDMGAVKQECNRNRNQWDDMLAARPYMSEAIIFMQAMGMILKKYT